MKRVAAALAGKWRKSYEYRLYAGSESSYSLHSDPGGGPEASGVWGEVSWGVF